MLERKILLGLTGSVATVLYKKLVEELQTIGVVDVIITDRARHFIKFKELCDVLEKKNGVLYSDMDEWCWGPNTKWSKT